MQVPLLRWEYCKARVAAEREVFWQTELVPAEPVEDMDLQVGRAQTMAQALLAAAEAGEGRAVEVKGGPVALVSGMRLDHFRSR